jgi:hypothetical protein
MKLTAEEFKEIQKRTQWHGNCLGDRKVGPYTMLPLLHILLAEYATLKQQENQ